MRRGWVSWLCRLGLCAAAGISLGAASAPRVNDALLMADAPAQRLSDYGLFQDAAGRKPSPGPTPYRLNTPLFSDYAEKTRYLYLPVGAVAAYRDRGVLDLPVGAVLVKSFAFPADLRQPTQAQRTVETRLLIRKAKGWVALTYVWNAEATEAELKRAGARLPVHFIDRHGQSQDISYVVPNVNQCKQCHSLNGELSPIGPKARNLNGDFAYADGVENQLTHLSRRGLLTGAPDPEGIPRTAVWDQAGASLPEAARAYLDGNCGHCHNRAGLASNSGLYLDWEETDPAARGVGKRPVAAGRASGGYDFSIAPGDPDHSIIVYRMASTEPGVMMPQIGRSLAHEEGLALIRAYIASLKSEPGRK